MVAKDKDIVEAPVQNTEILSAHSFQETEAYNF